MSTTHRRCDNCKFWDKVEGVDDAANGFCRRRSPQAALIGPDADHLWAYWPRTWADQWCGEIEVLKAPVF